MRFLNQEERGCNLLKADQAPYNIRLNYSCSCHLPANLQQRRH